MGDVSKWSEAALDELTDVLKKTYDGIAQETDGLEKQLEPLLETWEGKAREAYHDAKSQWEAAQLEVADIINELSSAIQDIKGGFMDTEKGNEALFG
jgi:early secretory antigenic target protein ESAT-6